VRIDVPHINGERVKREDSSIEIVTKANVHVADLGVGDPLCTPICEALEELLDRDEETRYAGFYTRL
jgi:hypothetical protein